MSYFKQIESKNVQKEGNLAIFENGLNDIEVVDPNWTHY